MVDPTFEQLMSDEPVGPTVVVNLRREAYDVYIGRGGLWGNPYRIGPKCSRAEAIRQYRGYIALRLTLEPELRAKFKELKGKRLGCYCKPLPCHGDILVELLEAGNER
jgi:hypothetical protein